MCIDMIRIDPIKIDAHSVRAAWPQSDVWTVAIAIVDYSSLPRSRASNMVDSPTSWKALNLFKRIV